MNYESLSAVEGIKLLAEKKEVLEAEIAKKVIGIAIGIHTKLGPGLLESAYKECLFYKIKKSGLKFKIFFYANT